MTRGCHRLIRDGAQLVESADEVLDVISPLAADLARALRGDLLPPEHTVPATRETADTLDPDYNRLWKALGHDPTGMDELVERSGLTTAAVSSILLALELDGKVAAEHGRYTRIGL